MQGIYLDHAATTPIRPEVRQAMEPYLADIYANASSIYRQAQQARAAIDAARDTVAACLRARPSEVVFTSGGTESDNAALRGAAFAGQERGRHLVTTAIEHHAVLHTMEDLAARYGFELSVVKVPRDGIVRVSDIADALRPDTVLVSVMWANNEIGTIQPIAEIASLVRNAGAVFHVDAVQAAGAIPIDLSTLPVDLLSLSAHKFYGPKGSGVLFVRDGTPWWPTQSGGAQERERRAGTENVAGIVGLARALELAQVDRDEESERLSQLRDFVLTDLERRIEGTVVNGDRERRLPNNLNVSFDGVHGESLLVGLDLAGIMASSGSACTSGSLEPSHVLQAIGVPRDLAQASLRLTLGRCTTRGEAETALDVLDGLVRRLRSVSLAHA